MSQQVESNPQSLASIDGFSSIDGNYGTAGFRYEVFKEGNQIVLAIGGTDPADIKTLLADSSFLCLSPATCDVVSHDFAAETQQAAGILAALAKAYPGSSITLTGHSLGGAIAQVLGVQTNLPTQAFDAPGSAALAPQLSSQLSSLTSVSFSNTGSNNNLRMYGDQVSVVGNIVGAQTTIATNTPETDEHIWASALKNHSIDNIVYQLTNNAAEMPGITGPVAPYFIGASEVIGGVAKIVFTVVTARLDYAVDPSGGSIFTFSRELSSPDFSSITLPDYPNGSIAYYDIQQLSNGVWSDSSQVQPLQTFDLLSNDTAVKFTALNASGRDADISDGLIFDVSFSNTGAFAGSLRAADGVPEPGAWMLLIGGFAAIGSMKRYAVGREKEIGELY